MTQPEIKNVARSARLDGIFQGLNQAVWPGQERTVACEWEDEQGGPIACLFVSGLHQRIEFEADMALSDSQLAQRMADAVIPLSLERIGLDTAKERGIPFTEVLLIHDIHRQLLANADIDLASYLDRIGNEKYIHHQPPYSNSDYFPVPSINGDMERLPQGLGTVLNDKHGRLNLTLNLTLSDAVILDITNTSSEFRIFGHIPQTITDSLVGCNLLDFIEIEPLAGAKAMVMGVSTSEASQMRPETHYIEIEHAMRYVHDPIWSYEHEQGLRERLSGYVRTKNID